MVGPNSKSDRFHWRVPLYAAALVFVLVSIIELASGFDAAFFGSIGVVLLTCFLCICAILMPIRDRNYRLALAVLCIIPATLFATALALRLSGFTRTYVRWPFVAGRYKAHVLQQANYDDGSLRHVEWDGSGFPGAGNTVEYLVYDPSDSLPRRTSSPGRFKGIPCEVPDVKRMQARWYIVLFYTDQAWNYCGE